jgi:pyruvate dehydrogenase E1 component
VLRAAEILVHYNVAADIWSVTSYNELYRDALNQESWNRLNPQEKPRQAYIEHIMENEHGLFIAVSDYVKAVPERLSKWFPDDLVVLGTDGFGLSEARDTLREHFQVSAEYIVYTALNSLYVKQKISLERLTRARNDLKIKS